MIYSPKDYEADPFLAVESVAALLRSGCLNLFVGAGASSGFGLPGWKSLVARLVGHGDDIGFLQELETKSDKELTKLIEPLDDGTNAYLKRVHTALYSTVADNLLDQLKESPLLLAIVALVARSLRGHVHRIFTYNYDDLLEQYLGMIGYVVCVRTNPSDFSFRSDVEVNYVHGRLPQRWDGADIVPELVLSEKSYRRRRAEINEGWSSNVENSLYSRSALLLGLSGDDSITLAIFERAKTRITRVADYDGFWLLTRDAFDRNESAIRDVGMCPIPIAREQLPEFVLAVCRAAERAT